MEQYIDKINNNLKLIKKYLGKIEEETIRVIGSNCKEINRYLELMGIPYIFCRNKYDDTTKKASFCLYHKSDDKKIDRRNGLSYGERNIVALILFLLSNNSKVLIIDDPASSYDEYRREKMLQMIYAFQKNRTVLLLSHDLVFVKFAILGKYMSIKENVPKIIKLCKNNSGKIYYFSNYDGNGKFLEIKKEDFDTLEAQVKEFIKNKNLCYYRKIINIRILSEIKKTVDKKYKNIYCYSSAIYHNTTKKEIYRQLEEQGLNEATIINDIEKEFEIKLETLPDDYFKDFNVKDLTNFEKIFYYRENASKLIMKEMKDEFSNIVHLNSLLFVSLNPYKFDYFSNNVYSIINSK